MVKDYINISVQCAALVKQSLDPLFTYIQLRPQFVNYTMIIDVSGHNYFAQCNTTWVTPQVKHRQTIDG